MDNRYYKTMCNVFQANSENTAKGPRWILPNHTITATLNSDHVDIHILFPNDTRIKIKCHTPMQTATICNMIILNEIVNIP